MQKAIKVYEKILYADSSDTRIYLKIAELYAKNGDKEKAVTNYQEAAETYFDQGYYLKSIAVYKQILVIAPEMIELNLILGDLYRQMGLISDALVYYQQAAFDYEQDGSIKDAFDILKKIIDLDSTNIPSRLKLAELYSREKMVDKAVAQFMEAADYLKKENRTGDYVKVIERVLYHIPDDLRMTQELANIYLQMGEAKKSLVKLQKCFQKNPKDVFTLQLLGEVFVELEQYQKVVSIYRELARLHKELGETAKSVEYYQKIIDIAGDDVEASAAIKEASLVLDDQEVELDEDILEIDLEEEDGEVERIINESEVYIKYGLIEKAIDHLRNALAISPNSREVHEMLLQVYQVDGQRSKIKEELLTLADICISEDKKDDSREFIAQVLKIAPNHSRAKELLASIDEDEFTPVEENEEEQLIGQETATDIIALEESTEIIGLQEVKDLAISGEIEIDPKEEEVDFQNQAILLGNETAPVEMAEDLGDSGGEDLAYDLEDIDFFIEQGLLSEAKEIVEAHLKAVGEDPKFRKKLAMIEAKMGGGAPEVSDSVSSDTAQSFDDLNEIADQLAEAEKLQDEQESVSVGDVFEEFIRKSDEKLIKSDGDIHFDMGLAFREMGLLDEAINEFSLAAESSSHQCESYQMVGNCFLEKELFTDAISCFKRGLNLVDISNEQCIGFYFDLGRSYENMGDTAEALYYYKKVMKLDKSYREVAQIISKLEIV